MHKTLLVLALATLTGCSSYDCAQNNIMGVVVGEQCGPFGFFGNHYFDDDMATLFLSVASEDFLTEESAYVGEYLPIFTMAFRGTHLEPGTVLDASQISGRCSRTQGYGTGVYFWEADIGSLEVVGPSNRAELGGKSWRFRWEVGCTDAGMFSTGDDVIELEISEIGFDAQLYGLPDDWPVE